MERRTRSLYSTTSRVISMTHRSTRWTCPCLTSLTNVTKDWRNPSCQTFMAVFHCDRLATLYLFYLFFLARMIRFWMCECFGKWRADLLSAATGLKPPISIQLILYGKTKKKPKKIVFQKRFGFKIKKWCPTCKWNIYWKKKFTHLNLIWLSVCKKVSCLKWRGISRLGACPQQSSTLSHYLV